MFEQNSPLLDALATYPIFELRDLRKTITRENVGILRVHMYTARPNEGSFMTTTEAHTPVNMFPHQKELNRWVGSVLELSPEEAVAEYMGDPQRKGRNISKDEETELLAEASSLAKSLHRMAIGFNNNTSALDTALVLTRRLLTLGLSLPMYGSAASTIYKERVFLMAAHRRLGVLHCTQTMYCGGHYLEKTHGDREIYLLKWRPPRRQQKALQPSSVS